MRIYPKISNQKFCEDMRNKVQNSIGIEIQFFDEGDIASPFNFENQVRARVQEFQNLKSIVVHPPLCNYNIELMMYKDESIVREQLKKLKKLSEELNIELCIIYHTEWSKKQFLASNLASRLAKLLKEIEDSNVYMLLENLYMVSGGKDECSAIEICKSINHPNLRCCIDTTHLHCKANIYKRNFSSMIEKELNKEDCEKYVKQIHFAAALNNDGYIDKKTHGRMHGDYEDLLEEYTWLSNLGLGDKVFVTEVSEDDYFSRKDQLKEIEMLERVNKGE